MSSHLRSIVSIALIVFNTSSLAAPDAKAIIKAAMDHWRGLSSYSVMSMTIHRPDWERTMTMNCWTLGDKQSLVRVTEPKKDAGNGTLLLDKQMWTFAPNINRVIRIPSSMMNQSWMGSDFSNKDVARSDDILDEYNHTLLSTENHDGHQIYVVESIPKEDSAIVWGKEILKIRDDNVLLEHAFYDQAMKKVKILTTLKIKDMGGRTLASQQRMNNVEKTDEWTEIVVHSAEFNIDISKNTFTLSNLRNPRH
ncbi:outer membrane lipoprotein-sorting protein [Kaarinaea lacus]